ncbi:MAG: carboxypeptidase regulatory-like domain-containing protein [Acidobacteria bacterium]|nr:carboxypeptidase regulatory-like domain-containing protein [Acidobacteriota bacterium]
MLTREDTKAAMGTDQIAPTPIEISFAYEPCKFILDVGDPRFPQVSTAWEFFINSGPSYPALNALVNATNPQRQVFFMDENPNLFVSISDSGNSVITGWNLSWTTSADLDRLVSIVAVRGQGGTAMNVYSYPNLAASDNGTFTAPGGAPITEVRFCFEPFSGPSSAPVAISGRALTAEGMGISGTRITAVNISTGESHSAITNPFGYYSVEGLVSEAIYMVTATHKRHTFLNNQRTITVSEEIAGVDFVAP